ncbi:MAG: 2,3-diphosphoglycerate synthetase [Actinomycetota bacterium]|nr:2,3-diphosphoglycerate synthetase [Actinomycetota bacterium]
MKVLVLVDGEHYPPVTRWGIQAARSMGHEVVGALFLGGTEKVSGAEPPDLGVPTVAAGADRMASLAAALGTDEPDRPEAVLDLSDEPILGYRERMELAAVALSRGVPYLGPDFRLDPPVWAAPLPVPTLAVIGTGKRTGKTAIAGEAARVADAAGLHPVVVAMGRGGPAAPQVAEAGSVTVESLLDLVRRGQHAASDYLEDALFTGVPTVGARRSGGGLAGAPFVTNVREAADLALELGAGVIILEGSGSAVPPIPWDAAVLVAPAQVPEEYIGGYLGPFRILLSDLFVVTMASGPSSGPKKLFALESHVQRLNGDARFVVTDFQPAPLRDVRGRAVYFTTTAPEEVAARQVAHLESEFGCRVVGHSTHLADRMALVEDLERAEGYDMLLTELKAAAVDVASERAMARGAEVVFVDNRAVTVSDGPELPALLEETLERAVARHARRNP